MNKIITYLFFLAISGLMFCTVLGFMGQLYWVFDLFSHFRLQYVWLLFFCLSFVLLHKRWVWVGVASSALLLNLLVVVAHNTILGGAYTPSRDTSASHSTRIYFANIYFKNTDTTAIIESITKADADVIIVAEVTNDMFDALQKTFSATYPYSARSQEKESFGIAILSKIPPTNPITVHYFGGSPLPSLEIQLDVDGNELSIIGTHPIPALNKIDFDSRNAQLTAAAEYTAGRGHAALLIGDFNNTPYSPTFQHILKTTGLQDSRIGFGLQQSWPTFLPALGFRMPIDHALHTLNLSIIDRHTGFPTGADHLPIIVDIAQ